MMSFAERLKSELAQRDMSITELARQANVSPQSIHVGLANEGWRPRNARLEMIAKALNVSPEYLVTGYEPPKPGKELGPMVPITDALQRAPVFKLSQVSAGFGTPQFDTEATDFKHVPYEISSRASGQLAFVKVNGDSMSPRILNGDYLIVEATSDLHPESQIYVILINGDTLVKRVHRVGKQLHIISDNPAYPPTVLDEGDDTEVKILARYLALQRNGE